MKKNTLLKGTFFVLFTAFSLGTSAQVEQNKKVKITDFQVVQNKNKVSINWSTDRAVPTNYFEVERSNDGKNFKTVAYVLGPDPAKTGCDCYGCFDKVISGKKQSYYRLKHVDVNGDFEFSNVKMVALR